jgi:hypothetical protein
MSRRSDERRGEEEWRAAADPDAQKPASSLGRVLLGALVVIGLAVVLYVGWRMLGAG